MSTDHHCITDDFAAVERVEQRFLLVEDYISMVITRHIPGLYIHGDGGIGKSFRVLNYLSRQAVSYRLHNSRMTAKGLFLALARSPNEIHILEDMERITDDRDAQGVLRSALWSQPGHDRIVTWTTQGGEESVKFDGGLIMISNRPLGQIPELAALKTRINVLQLEFSDIELIAYMRKLASKGFAINDQIVIHAEDAGDVTEFLIATCRQESCKLDLRLQQKAFRIFLQFGSDAVKLHWTDLIRASVKEAASSLKNIPDCRLAEDRKAERRQVVGELLDRSLSPDERIRIYRENTGHSKADFYRRKAEIESGEFD